MASDFRPEGRQNSGDNVFEGIPVGKEEPALFTAFLAGHDFSANSRRAFTQDMRKFAAWFSSANRERFVVGRVTTRDVTDFRDHLRREQGQAVATVNRALVTVRRFFAWLIEQGHVASNPAKKVKELSSKRWHRRDWIGARCAGCFGRSSCGRTCGRRRSSRCLYTGCRVSDLVNLELPTCSWASGAAPWSSGSAKATSSVPSRCLFLPACIEAYLETRPPVQSQPCLHRRERAH